jgi:hypothetical protein
MRAIERLFAGSDRENLMTMRLRIQTVPPLPKLKAWFPVDSTDSWATVHDLKSALCSRVQVLRDASVQALHVVLFLDDFELLKESDINVVRDGDLICIKPSSTPILCKRTSHEGVSTFL